MSEFNLQSVLDREDGLDVVCLNVDLSGPGCSDTEALTKLREALEFYFEFASDNDAPPVEVGGVRALTLPERLSSEVFR